MMAGVLDEGGGGGPVQDPLGQEFMRGGEGGGRK